MATQILKGHYNNSNNNTHICIATYRRNFRGAVARECASERKRKGRE